MRHQTRLVLMLGALTSASALNLAAGCGTASNTEPPVSRTERIGRTSEALSDVLSESAALAEATRLVDLCIESPESMLSESVVWDPDGPELFESIDDASRSRAGSAKGILVAELACTPGAYSVMQDLQNI